MVPDRLISELQEIILDHRSKEEHVTTVEIREELHASMRFFKKGSKNDIINLKLHDT